MLNSNDMKFKIIRTLLLSLWENPTVHEESTLRLSNNSNFHFLVY